jgi:SSS family solute:Na+ symporter
MHATTIDTTVIFVFSAFVLGIGLLFARTGRNLKSFFAGGEAVPWFIGGLSLFMSFFSAGTFVAWGSIAYKNGFVAITIQWTMCLAGIITAFWLAPRWKATGALTAAEFIKARLGGTVQKLYIYIFLAVSLVLKGSVLYPVAKLVSVSLGYPLETTTVVLGLFMIAYTAVGGLWAVMVTDILQFVILTAAVLLLLPLALHATGGFEAFTHKVPQGFFEPLGGEYTSGFVAAFLLYHIIYIGGNWTFVQRYTSVDSPKSAKKVALLFAGLYLVSPVLWMLPPMIYRTLNPNLTGLDTENAYLLVCRQVLPPGLMGLMLTGMYFSTSATANTTLNVVSAIFTNDIYKGLLRPHATDRQLMRVARWASWGFGLGMIGIALLVPAAGGMVAVVLSIGAITGGPLLAPPVWALFSKRLTSGATLLISGLTLVVNLGFKFLYPWLSGSKLTRAEEYIVGVGLPVLLLLAHELWAARQGTSSPDYLTYLTARETLAAEAVVAAASSQKEQEAKLEKAEIVRQNRFGLRVIAGALAFTALLLFGLSFLVPANAKLVALLAGGILLLALIPWRAAAKLTSLPEPAPVRAVEIA